MGRRLAAALLCLAILEAPAGLSAPRDDKAGVLRGLAERVGHVLGAASICSNVDQPRVKAIADKFTNVIRSASLGEDEKAGILEFFDANYRDGAKSPFQADCASAARDLSDLENASSPAPQARTAAWAPGETQSSYGSPVQGIPIPKSASAWLRHSPAPRKTSAIRCGLASKPPSA